VVLEVPEAPLSSSIEVPYERSRILLAERRLADALVVLREIGRAEEALSAANDVIDRFGDEEAEPTAWAVSLARRLREDLCEAGR
jgi:hypothetical protein